MRCLLDEEKVLRELLKFAESYQDILDAVGKVVGLQPYEIATVRLVACGLCDKEIARRLGVKRVTVTPTLARIYEKLYLESRTQLALWALRVGLIRLDDAWAIAEQEQMASEP